MDKDIYSPYAKYTVPVELSSFLKILVIKATGKETPFTQTILFSPSLSDNVFRFWYCPFFLLSSENAIKVLNVGYKSR